MHIFRQLASSLRDPLKHAENGGRNWLINNQRTVTMPAHLHSHTPLNAWVCVCTHVHTHTHSLRHVAPIVVEN